MINIFLIVSRAALNGNPTNDSNNLIKSEFFMHKNKKKSSPKYECKLYSREFILRKLQ